MCKICLDLLTINILSEFMNASARVSNKSVFE